jgi:hypothetical protein
MVYIEPYVRQSELYPERFKINNDNDSVIRAIKMTLNYLQDLFIIYEFEIPALVASNVDT